MAVSGKDIEAGRAFVRLFLKNDMRRQLVGALQFAGAKLKSFGRGTMLAGAGLTAGGAALIAPLTAAVKSFASQGDWLDKTAKRTGIAGAALAEFSFAAEQSGTELGTFENAIRRMQRNIEDAKRGLSTAVDGLDMVGMSVKDLEGLSPEDQFQKIAEGMAAIQDPTKKAAAAQMLFGRSGTQLLPMVDNLKALRQEARDLGIIPAQEEIDNAAKVTDAINRVRRVVKKMIFDIGAGLAGPALRFLDIVKNLAKAVGVFAKRNAPLLISVAAIGAALVVAGGALTAFGAVIWGTGVALSALGAAVGVILSPVGLLVGALAGGAIAWFKFTESGKRAWSSLKAAVLPIIDTLKNTFGGVADALKSGDWELAGKIAMAGLKLAILQGLGAIRSAFPKTFDGVLRVFAKVGDGIVAAWNKVTGFLTDQWNNWGKRTLDTVIGVASRIPQIWQQTVEAMANWMLATSAKGGVMGKAMSKVLGVDMSKEQAKATQLENERRRLNMRSKQEEISQVESELASGVMGSTGRAMTEADRRVKEKQLERTRSELADLQAGGSGTAAGGGTYDVLADARKAVHDYTQSLIDNAKNLAGGIGGKPGQGPISEGLESFLDKLASGAGAEDVAKELAALRKEAAERAAKAEKSGPTAAVAPVTGGPAAAAVPTGVGLTATYSAAAARIAGYQPGAGGPEERTAAGVESVVEQAKAMASNLAALLTQGQMTQGMFERFLAGWRVG